MMQEYIVLNLVAVVIFVVAIVLITLFAIESSFAKQSFVGVICVVSYIMCTIGAPLLSFVSPISLSLMHGWNIIQVWVKFLRETTEKSGRDEERWAHTVMLVFR